MRHPLRELTMRFRPLALLTAIVLSACTNPNGLDSDELGPAPILTVLGGANQSVPVGSEFGQRSVFADERGRRADAERTVTFEYQEMSGPQIREAVCHVVTDLMESPARASRSRGGRVYVEAKVPEGAKPGIIKG